MTPDTDKLLQQALLLSPEARAALAGLLLDSLDDTVDPQAEDLWEKELSRRIGEIDSGKVRPIPWARARHIIAGQP